MLYRPKQGSPPERDARAKSHNPTISGLGEELSLERDALSPKTWALRLSERLEQNQGRVAATFA